jgi:hypothetical protein
VRRGNGLRRGLLIAPLLIPALVAQGERAFVEIVADQKACYVQQPILLRVRVGYDRAFFTEQAVGMFRQQLDVPLQVQAPWFPVAPQPSGSERLRIAWNDAAVEAGRVADEDRGGSTFTVLELVQRHLPAVPGELVVPPPRLRFAYATRFADDILHGRVPADRHEVVVDGKGLALQVQPLPVAGQPSSFTGAVGRFRVQASAEPRELEAGQSLKLVLVIDGAGNFESFGAPAPERLGGLRVQGRIETREPARRVVTYDLVASDETVREVPALEFAFFDPAPPAGYRTVRTEPIPIRVRGASAGARPPAETARSLVPGENDIHDLKPVAHLPHDAAPARPSTVLLLSALLAPWLVALGLRSLLRAWDARDPLRRRAQGAAAAFRTRAGEPDVAPEVAFTEYLAARLCCPVAAVITADLEHDLAGAGIPADLAARAAAALQAMVAARYGGNALAPTPPELAALVAALDAAFRAGEAKGIAPRRVGLPNARPAGQRTPAGPPGASKGRGPATP